MRRLVPMAATRRLTGVCTPLATPFVASRCFSMKSPNLGPIAVEEGFWTKDAIAGEDLYKGGTFARGVFAASDISVGREIFRLPSRYYYVGDEPLREQVLVVAKELFEELVTRGPHHEFVNKKILGLMHGGRHYFYREKDAEAFAESVPGGMDYLARSEMSTKELQKLPMIVEFNRWDVEYNGRKGFCLCPEASYFNHDCEPNVLIDIVPAPGGNGFVVKGRTTKPVKRGEQLYIHYLHPNVNLPLTRQSMALRERWSFDCGCTQCVSRMMNAAIFWVVIAAGPFAYYLRQHAGRRYDEQKRKV